MASANPWKRYPSGLPADCRYTITRIIARRMPDTILLMVFRFLNVNIVQEYTILNISTISIRLTFGLTILLLLMYNIASFRDFEFHDIPAREN